MHPEVDLEASSYAIVELAGTHPCVYRYTLHCRGSFSPIPGTVSLETILKIQELKRLAYKHPQYYSNPDAVIKCATYWSINGGNKVLDEMLEQLRIDLGVHNWVSV
jgi:hypothetical protein